MISSITSALFILLGVSTLVSCAEDEPITQEKVETLYAEVVLALEEGAQVHLAEPVPVIVLTADEARERRINYSKDLEDASGITAGMDVLADFVFSENMLGRYLPDEKVIYVIKDVVEAYSSKDPKGTEDFLFGIMAHELVHGYDDQTYGVMPLPSELFDLSGDPSMLPELQARMSLLEGRATYASELACQAVQRESLPIPTVESAQETRVMKGGDPGQDALAGVVNLVARAKMAQYAYGRNFAKEAYRFGGEKFFRHVFDSLPLSMAELEDFERFRQRWAEEMIEKMEKEEVSSP